MPIERFNAAMVTAFAAFHHKDRAAFEAAVNAAKQAVQDTDRDLVTQGKTLDCLNQAVEEFPATHALVCLSEAANFIACSTSYSRPPNLS